MYFYDRQLMGGGKPHGERSITVRPCQRSYDPESTHLQYPFTLHAGLGAHYLYRLGEPAPATKGLRLPEHFHFPKKPDPHVPGAFITGPVTKMTASDHSWLHRRKR